MKIKDAKWNPSKHGKPLSKSVQALRILQISDVKRLIHDDVACHYLKDKNDKSHLCCSLAQEIRRLRKKIGWQLEYYHEGVGVLVIRRIG